MKGSVISTAITTSTDSSDDNKSAALKQVALHSKQRKNEEETSKVKATGSNKSFSHAITIGK